MQSIIVIPITFTVLLAGVHFVQLIHGGHVATVAAARGAQIASTIQDDGSGSGSVAETVREMVRDLGSDLAGPPLVGLGGDSVSVTVAVQFPGAVPFLPTHVVRSVTVPRERFIYEDER